jgi:hypothetical protein
MVVTNRCYVFEMALQRFYRTIVMRGAALAGGSALTVICSCDGGGDEAPDVYCPSNVTLHSACGFEDITTTCANGTSSCNGDYCTVGTSNAPIKTDCSIDVKAADGTMSSIAVTANGCVLPGYVEVKCKTPDGGLDATVDGSSGDAALDVDARDTSSDVSTEGG